MLGAILLVGAIGVFDLRLLGYGRDLARDALDRALTPLAVAGFVVMVASGAVLFAADPVALAASGTFRLKLWLIAAAGANALAFRWMTTSRYAPLLALVSLALWLGVVIAGRLIAYL